MSELSKAHQAIIEAWMLADDLRYALEEAIMRCEELPQDHQARREILSALKAERTIVAGTTRVLDRRAKML